MYRLSFYVPESNLESVKEALFKTGAGRIGQYDSCCWQTLGQGQFRPLVGSSPHLGKSGKLETVKEYQVEMICEDHLVKEVITALKKSHPYEEPAYAVWKIEQM